MLRKERIFEHKSVINLVAGLFAYHFLEKTTAQKLYPQDFKKMYFSNVQ